MICFLVLALPGCRGETASSRSYADSTRSWPKVHIASCALLAPCHILLLLLYSRPQERGLCEDSLRSSKCVANCLPLLHSAHLRVFDKMSSGGN